MSVVSQCLTGVIAKHFGWKMSFYVLGALSALWLPLWFFLARYFIFLSRFIMIKLVHSFLIYFVSDSPSKCRNITIEEVQFLQENKVKVEDIKKAVPWINIVMSLPFWVRFKASLFKKLKSSIISIFNHLKGHHGGSFFVQLSNLYLSDNFTDVSEKGSWIRYIYWRFRFNPPLYFHVDNSTLASKNCSVRL